MSAATARGVWRRIARASADVLAADVVHHQPGLARRAAHELGLRAHGDGAASRRAEPRRSRGGGLAACVARRAASRQTLLALAASGASSSGACPPCALSSSSSRAISSSFLTALGQLALLELGLELVDVIRVLDSRLISSSPVATAWPRNIRVGANSPSLWPTIDSEMNTGHVLAAVVHGDRVAHHLGEDRGGARPGLDHLLVAGLVHAPRCAPSGAPRPTGPSWRSGSSSGIPSCRAGGRARCSGPTSCSSCASGSPAWARPRA